MKYLQEFSHSKKQHEIPPFQNNVPYRTVMALKTATLFARKTEYHGLVIETRLQKTKYPNKSRNTSRNSHSKKQLEIPPRIPIPKSNVKYLHSKMLQREIPP